MLSLLTLRQVGYWHSEYDLWSHDLEVAPNSPLAVSNLGDALNKMGRTQEALPLLEKSVELLPADAVRHGNLAVDLVQCDRLQDSIAEYETAISLASEPAMQAHFYDSLAAVYDALEDYPKVRESYEQALKVSPAKRHHHDSVAHAKRRGPTGGASLRATGSPAAGERPKIRSPCGL